MDFNIKKCIQNMVPQCLNEYNWVKGGGETSIIILPLDQILSSLIVIKMSLLGFLNRFELIFKRIWWNFNPNFQKCSSFLEEVIANNVQISPFLNRCPNFHTYFHETNFDMIKIGKNCASQIIGIKDILALQKTRRYF